MITYTVFTDRGGREVNEDSAREFEDHALDECRYAVMFKKREVFFGSSMG